MRESRRRRRCRWKKERRSSPKRYVVFLLFSWAKIGPNSLSFSRFLRVTKRCFPTLSRTRCERIFARKKTRPKCVCSLFKRERERKRRACSSSAVKVVSSPKMFFVPLVFFSILSEGLLQVLEKQNPPLLCFSKEKLTLVLSFLCAFSSLKSTEKEMGKTRVKPEREAVASEDARESER